MKWRILMKLSEIEESFGKYSKAISWAQFKCMAHSNYVDSGIVFQGSALKRSKIAVDHYVRLYRCIMTQEMF